MLILANFCQIRKIKSMRFFCCFVFVFCFVLFCCFFKISKTYIITFLHQVFSQRRWSCRNILQDIQQYKQRQHRKENANLFIISSPFDLRELSLLYPNNGISKNLGRKIMLFEISKNLGRKIMLFEILKNLVRSSVTHILAAVEQTTKNQNIEK